MSWRRGLAGLIWGAVVMIAIQLVPTTVRAHTGHAHVAGEHVSGAHVAGSISTVPDHRAADHTARLATGQARVTAELTSGAPDDERSAAPACKGGCCASGCPCCVPMDVGRTRAELASPFERARHHRSSAADPRRHRSGSSGQTAKIPLIVRACQAARDRRLVAGPGRPFGP